MKKVTIDRATWRAGTHGAGSSELLNGEGLRCCLGFLALECGVSDEDTLRASLPRHCPGDGCELFPEMLFEDGPSKPAKYLPSGAWEDTFALINDAKYVDDATRESWIATGFRIVLGYEVEFVREYPR